MHFGWLGKIHWNIWIWLEEPSEAWLLVVKRFSREEDYLERKNMENQDQSTEIEYIGMTWDIVNPSNCQKIQNEEGKLLNGGK